jgi:hypothetical protein
MATPAVIGKCTRLEGNYKVPAIALVLDTLYFLSSDNAKENGMPELRIAVTKGPMGGNSYANIRKNIDGLDPRTNVPLMPEIITMLTAPLTAKESIATGTVSMIDWPATYTGTKEEIQTQWEALHWTDMYDIVPPTEEKIAAMLAMTSHKPDEVIGTMAPTTGRAAWTWYVRTVAINAVMAGASPDLFVPILALSATKGACRGSSTRSFGAFACFNGPIRKQLDLPMGIGAMSAIYNKTAVTIGKAWGLTCGNTMGGSRPGLNYAGNIGNSLNDTPPIIAEYEEVLPPGWNPLHVQSNFKREDSCVTPFGSWYTQMQYMTIMDENWEYYLNKSFQNGILESSKTILADPNIIPSFVRLGFDTKEKIADWAKKNVTVSRKDLWLEQDMINYHLQDAMVNNVEPWATYYKAKDTDQIAYMTGRVAVIAVGGGTNIRWHTTNASRGTTINLASWGK